jgi:hypothetical protein
VGCRGEGNLQFTFKFEMFYSGSEILVAHSNITVAPKFIYLFIYNVFNEAPINNCGLICG